MRMYIYIHPSIHACIYIYLQARIHASILSFIHTTSAQAGYVVLAVVVEAFSEDLFDSCEELLIAICNGVKDQVWVGGMGGRGEVRGGRWEVGDDLFGVRCMLFLVVLWIEVISCAAAM